MSSGRGNRNVRTKGYKDRMAKLDSRVADLAAAAFEAFQRDPEKSSSS